MTLVFWNVYVAWNLGPSVHWNATGKALLVASAFPVCFKWGLLQSLQSCYSVGCKVKVSPGASQCGAVLTKFLHWHSSVGLFQLKVFPVVFQCTLPYSLGRPVVFKCTLGQPVTFQWHSSVHWSSQCTLAQGKGCQVLLVTAVIW